MTSPLETDPDGIAIVGMTGRFPGAADLEQFWANLRDGAESIARFSPAELAEAGIPEATSQHPAFVNAGGVLDDAELFDASFFGLSAREAEVLDPQHRVFMECAWHAVESAGYDPESYPGVVGVFAGAAMSSYLFNIVANHEVMALVGPYQVLLGNDKDHLATRVSYKLNLKGPAVTVQTACSTSLVAVCMACQSLLDHQCDMALAGGVSIKVPQTAGYVYQEGMINSPDGHCRPFDARAKGTVGGNGVGIAVLKRAADAIADGDHIRAVIRGSAINNDGSLKVGYTAPSVEGQAEVVAMAQAMAGVSPDSISYVEAHGTATPLGDPVEIAALTQAFRAGTEQRGFCAIGSVKSNIGHLDPASGIAGLLKAALMLEHRWLPPSLHYSAPNAQIDFAGSPFYVNAESKPWEAAATPRRAGVSSFGIGGTNAHVVLEEAPPVADAPGAAEQVVVVSARTSAALETATANLADHLRRHPEANLADVCYTAQVGRRAFDHRRMVVASSVEDAVAALGDRSRRADAVVRAGDERSVVFMFPGQGSQYVNMGRELYEREPAFRAAFDHCAAAMPSLPGVDLRSIVYPDHEDAGADARLTATQFAQPALFAVEYALARLWSEWGVRPAAMIGHSIGEYVAACLAGVFSLEDALTLVVARGQLMSAMPAGEMLAITAPRAQVEALMGDDVDLAAVNGPAQCVAAGSAAAIAALEARMTGAGVRSSRLRTSHAFHSRLMDPMLPAFRAALDGIELRPPQLPFVSNVSGGWITPERAADAAYWVEHVRRTVCFGEGIGTVLQEPGAILIEAGPGGVLGGLARGHSARSEAQLVLQSVRRAQEPGSDARSVRQALGRLWLAGVPIDWQGVHGHERRRRVPLPAYPFERQRYWIGPRASTNGAGPHAAPGAGAEPAPSRRSVDDWFSRPVWRRAAAVTGSAASAALATQRRWLVFGDASPNTLRIVDTITRAGGEVQLVEAADRFEPRGAGRFGLDPGEPSQYRSLLQELATVAWAPDRILHLWSTTAGTEAPSPASFAAAQVPGFYSLLFLAQALAAEQAGPTRIAVITSSLQRVTGDERIRPETATLASTCKIISQELPELRCQHVDLPAPGDAAWSDDLVTSVLADVAGERRDAVIAYRGPDRWVQAYEPIRLDPARRHRSLLRDEGVYLITGGLGSIGLLLAEELSSAVKAKLVLVGHSPFPAPEDWDRWGATHDAGDRVSQTIHRLRAAGRDRGSDVLVRTADVADEAQMRRVIDEAHGRFGRIDGILHAAGVTSADAFAFIPATDRELCERHFAPKVGGLLVLERLLRGSEPDFWLLFSSLSTVLGGLGYAAYAASNSFMDAFAAGQNAQGSTPWICVDWDGWDFGRSAGPGIRPEHGLDAVRRIVADPPELHVVVSVDDLAARARQWIELEPAEAAPVATPGSPLHARPDLATPYAAPRSDVEQAIAGTWQALLGVEPVGIHDNFFELGGDSLLAIQLTSRLRDSAGIELSIQGLFDAPTIASLAGGLQPSSGAQPDTSQDDEMAKILALVEQLSDDEVEALLAESERGAE